MRNGTVLMVGSGEKVRGGIASVIKAYRNSDIWSEYGCRWLETHSDVSARAKIKAACIALVRAPFLMSSSDIVHIHTASDVSLYRKTLFLTIAKILRKKTIVHLHAADDEGFFVKPLYFFARYVFSSADLVLVLSQYWDHLVHTIAPGARTGILPNPCDMKPVYAGTTAVPHKGAHKTILFAGKLEPRKGFADLLQAMPRVLSKEPDARLILAGHGDIASGEAIASQLGISSSVSFTGWLTGPEKEKIFREASVFCLPSYKEGVPMAMLEAIGYGVPIIVTPVGGIPDLVQDGCNGLLVAPGDSSGIADSILKLLSDEELSRKLSSTALETIHHQCSIETVCSTLRKTYDHMLTEEEPRWAK